MKKLNLKTPSAIRRTIERIATEMYNGEIDAKKGNAIIFACNSALAALRTDEQDKKIEELETILEEKADK